MYSAMLTVKKKYTSVQTHFEDQVDELVEYIYNGILKKAQSELTNAYLKYIQEQINKIGHSVEHRQSRIAKETINEVSKRKSTAREKRKADSQEERIHLWKEHFKNLHGKLPRVTDETVMKIMKYQLDIKLVQFMQEPDVVLPKIKNRKAAVIDEIPPEVQ